MLSGFVFFSTSSAAFLGGWLGGYLFDPYRSYSSVADRDRLSVISVV